MKKTAIRVLGTIGIILACSTLLFASTWEGSAIIGNYGDFPDNGSFAACNSFSRNTVVEVTNLENGRKTTVIITRSLDVPGIFMSLSSEAARALGIRSGSVARVRATIPRTTLGTTGTAGSRTVDPDFNPRQLAEAELQRLGYLFPETPAAPSAPVAPVAPVTPVAPIVPPAVVEAPATVAAPSAEPVATPLATSKPLMVAPELPETTPVPDAALARAETFDSRIIPPPPLEPQVVASVPETLKPAVTPPPAATTPAATAPVPSTADTSQPGASRAQTDAAAKPRPIRTIIIAALPEPVAPAKPVPPTSQIAAAPAAPTTEPAPPVQPVQPAPDLPVAQELPVAPAVMAFAPPQPEEQPVVLPAEREPKRQQSLMLSPETYAREVPARLTPEVRTALGEPGEQPVTAIDRTTGRVTDSGLAADLTEPLLKAQERALAMDRSSLSADTSVPALALTEPLLKAQERATAMARSSFPAGFSVPVMTLDEPLLQARQHAMAMDRINSRHIVAVPDSALAGLSLPEPLAPLADQNYPDGIYTLENPARSERALSILLENPQLGPEELPNVYLSWLVPPGSKAPAVDLIDGILVLEDESAPLAFSRETPYFEAMETRVELADAAAKAKEQPMVASRDIPGQVSAAEVSAALADAELKAKAPLLSVSAPVASNGEEAARETRPVVTLQPTAPRPPQPSAAQPSAAQPSAAQPAAPSVAAPSVAAPAVAQTPATPSGFASALQPGRFYIQLAAYSSEAAARLAAASMVQPYGFVIEAITVRGSTMYRLYAGPFNRDESGVVLMQIRSSGFRDAFVKQGS